jgi:signal transduction histidine kinase
MNQTPDPQPTTTGDAVAGAERDLARVQGKIDAARAVLLRLLQEVVVAESRLDRNQAAHLMEANEQLLVSALRDQTSAQAAALASSEVEGSAASDPQSLNMAAHARRHAQLREANEQLVLAALGAKELQAAAESAQQRHADLMDAVAEELGNPHAPIRVAAAMLGRVAGDEVLLPRVQTLVAQQTAHMLRLVQQAIARARAMGSLLPVGQQVCDLAGVIDAAVRDARPMMALRHQRLTVVVPAGPITVRGDGERMNHVLGNLLDNASKYTSDHGTVRLDAVVHQDHIEISVTDDGIGIAPDAVPRIFEPFGHDTRAIGFNGISTGIGLPVVRVLVGELGGTVAAHSAGSGRGSRFAVTLPLADADVRVGGDARS